MKFTLMEQAVLNWIASRREFANLADQIAVARPVERELTGVGSFTRLALPPGCPPMAKGVRSPIMGPCIECEGIEHGGVSLLFINEPGCIEMLEMVACGERFDESATDFVLHEPGWNGQI